MLEEFKWNGFRGVRRAEKLGFIQVFMGLRHCLEDFAVGRSIAGFEVNGERFYVKRFRESLPIWRRLKSSSLRNAMLNEFDWLKRLELEEIEAPKVWLFMERRIGWRVEAFLLMSEVNGQPLATLDMEKFELACVSAVDVIARLHALGISHGDCNLYNFLAGDEVRLIDFERAAEVTPKRAEKDLLKLFARIKAHGYGHLLEGLASRYLQVQPQPLFDIAGLMMTLQGGDSPQVETRWRPPQFFSISIGLQQF